MTIEGFSMQDAGIIPYNPYNQDYGMSSPYDQFIMAGYDPYDTGWQDAFNTQGNAAFSGTGIEGYDPEADLSGYNQFGADYGYEDLSGGTGVENYNPEDDFAQWAPTPAEQPPSPSPSPTQPDQTVEEPPMPPWMQNLTSGQSFAPWSVIYDQPMPFASKNQWANMNPSEQRAYMGSIPEYARQDFIANMQKAFVPGVNRSSARSFIV